MLDRRLAPKSSAYAVSHRNNGRLRNQPFSGQVVSEIGQENIREFLQGIYRIIYRVVDSSVEILTVFHGSQLLDSPDS